MAWPPRGNRTPSEDPRPGGHCVATKSGGADRRGPRHRGRASGDRARDPGRPKGLARRSGRAANQSRASRLLGIPQASQRREHDARSGRATDRRRVHARGGSPRRADRAARFSYERCPAPHERRTILGGAAPSEKGLAEGVRGEGHGRGGRAGPARLATKHRSKWSTDAPGRGARSALRGRENMARGRPQRGKK